MLRSEVYELRSRLSAMEKDMEKLTSLLHTMAASSPEALPGDAVLATSTVGPPMGTTNSASASPSTSSISNKKRKMSSSSPLPAQVTSVSPEPMAVTSLSTPNGQGISNSKRLEVAVSTNHVPKIPPMPLPHKLTSSSLTLREESLGMATFSSTDEDILTSLFPSSDHDPYFSTSDMIQVDEDDFILNEDDPVIAHHAMVDPVLDDDDDDNATLPVLDHIPLNVPSGAETASSNADFQTGLVDFLPTEDDLRLVMTTDLAKLPQKLQKAHVDRLTELASNHPAGTPIDQTAIHAVACAIQKEAAAYDAINTVTDVMDPVTERNVHVATSVLDEFRSRHHQ